MARRLIQSGMMKKEYGPRDVDFRDRGSFYTRIRWEITISTMTWISYVLRKIRDAQRRFI